MITLYKGIKSENWKKKSYFEFIICTLETDFHLNFQKPMRMFLFLLIHFSVFKESLESILESLESM